YVTVTPLQMASLIGTVANDGVTYRPRLVQAIMDRTTGQRQELPTVPKTKLAVKHDTLKLIREALSGVVTEGTGGRARSSIVTIAGKNGTAQTSTLRTGPEKDNPNKIPDHTWVVAFAPQENPNLPLAVLAANMGHGGSAAAPLAKEVIETYIKLSSKSPIRSDTTSSSPLPAGRAGDYD